MSLYKPKAVYAASERQFTAAGREVQVPMLPLIPQPIHRTASARLAVDTTFTMETSISRT